MRLALGLSIFVVFHSLFAHAQQTKPVDYSKLKTWKIILPETDKTISLEMLKINPKKRAKYDKEYFWFKAQKVHHSFGDYEGNLLHGQYVEFDLANNLVVKGRFKSGLKEGVWLEWYPQIGRIKQKSNFKKGALHGDLYLMDSLGIIVSHFMYKRGLVQEVKANVSRKRPTKSLVHDSVKNKVKDIPHHQIAKPIKKDKKNTFPLKDTIPINRFKITDTTQNRELKIEKSRQKRFFLPQQDRIKNKE